MSTESHQSCPAQSCRRRPAPAKTPSWHRTSGDSSGCACGGPARPAFHPATRQARTARSRRVRTRWSAIPSRQFAPAHSPASCSYRRCCDPRVRLLGQARPSPLHARWQTPPPHQMARLLGASPPAPPRLARRSSTRCRRPPEATWERHRWSWPSDAATARHREPALDTAAHTADWPCDRCPTATGPRRSDSQAHCRRGHQTPGSRLCRRCVPTASAAPCTSWSKRSAARARCRRSLAPLAGAFPSRWPSASASAQTASWVARLAGSAQHSAPRPATRPPAARWAFAARTHQRGSRLRQTAARSRPLVHLPTGWPRWRALAACPHSTAMPRPTASASAPQSRPYSRQTHATSRPGGAASRAGFESLHPAAPRRGRSHRLRGACLGRIKPLAGWCPRQRCSGGAPRAASLLARLEYAHGPA